jgi:hypothetical protein
MQSKISDLAANVWIRPQRGEALDELDVSVCSSDRHWRVALVVDSVHVCPHPHQRRDDICSPSRSGKVEGSPSRLLTRSRARGPFPRQIPNRTVVSSFRRHPKLRVDLRHPCPCPCFSVYPASQPNCHCQAISFQPRKMTSAARRHHLIILTAPDPSIDEQHGQGKEISPSPPHFPHRTRERGRRACGRGGTMRGGGRPSRNPRGAQC